jgi:hypothetical protein
MALRYLTGPMRSRDSCSTDDSRLAGFGPDSGFGFVFSPRSSDSDRFRHSRFGFGSVPVLGVRIRISPGTRGSDPDRIGFCGFGFGSEAGSVRILHPNPGLGLISSDGSLQ